MASREQFSKTLQQPYDRILFAKEILKPVFKDGFTLQKEALKVQEEPTKTEKEAIDDVAVYGHITLDDGTGITCYEVTLNPRVRIEQSKVTIQRYVRKLLTVGEAALVNFISPKDKSLWRLTLVAKDSEIGEEGITEKMTHAKRYTYLVDAAHTNRTLIERFIGLAAEREIDLDTLIEAFSVSAMSDEFFNEYKRHYLNFVEYLTGKRMVKEKGKWKEKKTGKPSAFLQSVFNGNEKEARDFCKRLLGRIVFLYFVQRKGWLGASDTSYKDGDQDFMMNQFRGSNGSDFYPNYLWPLFFDTLNSKRDNDEYKMPEGSTVHIPFLNGGLFDRGKYDSDAPTFTESLFHNRQASDDPKQRGFLDFLNAYNFTIYEDSPDDHTVAVDPEMLGHIFENLLEENKEKGAFYTPKEIVHFMCQESLVEYLTTHLEKEYTVYKELNDNQVQLFGNDAKKGQLSMMEELGDKALNRTDVEQIVKEKNIAGLSEEQQDRISDLLDRVKVCDPAIGSGAFPMGILQEIFSIKEIIAYERNHTWNPAEVKENIIQNSVYGVDIERGAVDIARLRFWLSLLVDSETPQPLPNLEYKIVVGNSLVSKLKIDEDDEEEILEIDWEVEEGTQSGLFGNEEVIKRQELLKAITNKQKEYFHAETVNKKELALQIRNLKIDLLINQLFLMIRTKGEENKPNKDDKKAKERMERYLNAQRWRKLINKLNNVRTNSKKSFFHFDWKLDFPEVMNEQFVSTVGFDIMIGNPPYISHDKLNDSNFIRNKYNVFESFADVYCYFMEIAVKFIKNGGISSIITSNSFLRTDYGKPLREFLGDYVNVVRLINIDDSQIFNDAIVNVAILIAKKTSFRGGNALVFNGRINLITSFEANLNNYSFAYEQSKFTGGAKWSLLEPNKLSILEKIWQFSKTLYQLGATIRLGLATGYNKAFVIDEKKAQDLINEDSRSGELIKPVLRGRDIDRYQYSVNRYIILSKNGINISEEYPSLYKYFEEFGDEFKNRGAQGNHWTNLRACSFINDFKKEKIVWIELTDKGRFALSKEETYLLNSAYFMLPPNNFPIEYILAILNSKVIQFFMECTAESSGMGTLRWINNNVKNVPIPVSVSERSVQNIKNKVMEVMEAKEGGEDTYELEKEIDAMVYQLYGLTEEEVGVIEGEVEVGVT